jgi:transcriptional regulator with XRE-family HTH domain
MTNRDERYETKAGQNVLGEALGARLRAEREARGWTPRKLAEKFSAASRARCVVPDVESMIPQIHRWERGGSGVGERYRTLYCVVFGMRAELFAARQVGQEVKAGD